MLKKHIYSQVENIFTNRKWKMKKFEINSYVNN